MEFGNKNQNIEEIMICLEKVQQYCQEYWKIENYDLAMADTTQTWHCHGDKSTITAYMNFIYRLKTLQDDINLYVEYMTLPEDMGVLVHRQQKDTLRIQLDKDIMPVYWDEPNLIRRRLERYNDYLYFDELTEESFKNGYYVGYQGDYFWEEDDIPYQDKYKELIKCILNLLQNIKRQIESLDELQQRFPKLVKLIERNIEVCYKKFDELIEELENKPKSTKDDK